LPCRRERRSISVSIKKAGSSICSLLRGTGTRDGFARNARGTRNEKNIFSGIHSDAANHTGAQVSVKSTGFSFDSLTPQNFGTGTRHSSYLREELDGNITGKGSGHDSTRFGYPRK
jgi:hypothetical protein